MSRLVLNHSTHLPGLIPLLTKLAEELGGGRIVPGVISRTRGRAETFSLRLSGSPDAAGAEGRSAAEYKLVARKGKTMQEVLILSPASRKEVESALKRALQH
mmetsp:Transcript_35786/g.90249  ORF Transcript_35786/g.90249 Transcript_35786/m.90249 type:complete len:102 (+) Transcript_35786:149-454(+)|eukprot:jgi/Tetstr1/430817/TSEL_020600.t1